MESQSFRTKAECASVFAPTLPTESVNSSLPFEEFNDGVIDSRGAQTPESKVAGTEILGKLNDNVKQFNGSCILSEKRSSSLNIWSRRGKLATELCLQTSEWSTKTQGSTEIERESQEDSENIRFGKKFFSGSKVMDGVFSLDKENYTRNTRRKPMRKNSKLEESRTKSGTSPFASRVTSCPRTCAEEDIFALSDKENQTPKFLKQRTYGKQTSRNQVKLDQDMVLKKSVGERIPLQHIFADFTGSRMSKISTLNSASKSCNSSDYIEIRQKKNHDPVSINPAHDGKRSWTVLADITSLLDKGSRKSLKLLQGLKGTRLIVPRMVISELDSLKRKGTLFRRKSEASLALDWIDECLLETKWWIDVQSSEEDKRPIASTTPASPRSHFSDGSRGGTRISVPFLVRGSILEAFSPTAEDHILDCALSFRKKNNDGQLVLLSNDVTLKIKAIAEGFICETAQEFRDSLVNPFSDRFLWTGSTPRGQTWSVLDDIVLEERYYQNLLKKKSKVNGLKLVLPRNCHIG
ncbi:hypothetical protein K2173_011532 [Erythroxylum novogranatense]|uniref:PIN domain-containing protein n=1 Tax=Erythroxylum novogranatense TaxID=1862640 RepID=A0AAV8TT60_9ROSI|nr:hypothetical protein K2173_011532 [Erythroxylum novogranatense]